MSFDDDVFSPFYQHFRLSRNGKLSQQEVEGIHDSHRSNAIQIVNTPCAPMVGDILLDEFGGRFHIFRVEELKVFDGSCEYLVYFNDSNREPPAVTNNIRIGSIGGHAKAIVGSQQQALIGISLDEIKTLVAERRELSEGDRLQLLQLIQAAEKLQQSGDSLQKGVFSKFSKLAERHGDIIGAIIQTFVPMLFGH